jgi:hypothetical protein
MRTQPQTHNLSASFNLASGKWPCYHKFFRVAYQRFMATEYPPLGKSYVLSYSNDDKNYPVIAIKKDPRVDNYRRPDDLSPHPDPSRYPNHRFTSTQPTNTDERVIWIYEILPAPYVPFTRYDDDLGPVQGRRRFVANTGQEASLERDKKVTYEAREGSAIVSTEIEETWDAGSTDPDLDSPFPIKDRDFYDPSRGPVQERRQLISTTGDEVASLENNNGVITQTSYEAYNEYLSFKVVQTYSVKGPQLTGFATNNEGQLTTVTTQRKGSDGYTPPNPTATRTVESNREDAESVVERVVDVPSVFPARTFSIERPDPAPQKFRVELPTLTEQETIEGQAALPLLGDDEISKSEQQQTEFVKRTNVSKRTETPDGILIGKQTGEWGEETVTETYNEDGTIAVGYKILSNKKSPLGGNKFLGEKVEVVTPLALTETKKDAETGVVLTTTKTLVAAGTPLPAIGANQAAEIKPIDAYNSVQIITTVNSVPPPETFESSIDVTYPDVLEEIGIEWDSSVGGGAGSAGGLDVAAIKANDYNWSARANANASASLVGTVYTKIRRGHRGSVRASVTRTYYTSPPTTIPLETIFQPVYGTVTITGKGVSVDLNSQVGGFGDTVSGTSSGYGEEINNYANSTQFGPFCHSSPALANAVGPTTLSTNYTGSAGSVPAGQYPVTTAQAQASAVALLKLGTSNPVGSALKKGYSHIAAVKVEKWRFGIWIQEVYTAYHP